MIPNDIKLLCHPLRLDFQQMWHLAIQGTLLPVIFVGGIKSTFESKRPVATVTVHVIETDALRSLLNQSLSSKTLKFHQHPPPPALVTCRQLKKSSAGCCNFQCRCNYNVLRSFLLFIERLAQHLKSFHKTVSVMYIVHIDRFFRVKYLFLSS